MICMVSETVHNLAWICFYAIGFGYMFALAYISGMFDRILKFFGLKPWDSDPDRP
jgi:hypothetical protein